MESIIGSIITGGLALLGVVISNMATRAKSDQAIKIAQAITDTKIDNLCREVREHNNFAKRMPVVEEQIKSLHERLVRLEEVKE